MNYQHILSKAWEITWNNKYLWVFGFFAGLTLGKSSNDFNNSFIQGGAWLFQNLGNLLSTQSIIALILLVLSIVLWIVGAFARIGLIYEVDTCNAKYNKSISHVVGIFRASTPYFLPIVAMQLLIWSPVIVFSLIYGVLSQSFFTNAFSNSTPSFSPGFFGSFGTLWLMGCGIAIFSFFLSFVDAFAYRSLILNNSGVKGSIRESLNLLKDNTGSILLLAIICGALGAIFMIVLSLLLSPLLFFMMKPMMEITSQCMVNGGDFAAITQCLQQSTSSPSIILISLVSSIIMAALTSVWVTFQSATFTVAYNKLDK